MQKPQEQIHEEQKHHQRPCDISILSEIMRYVMLIVACFLISLVIGWQYGVAVGGIAGVVQLLHCLRRKLRLGRKLTASFPAIMMSVFKILRASFLCLLIAIKVGLVLLLIFHVHIHIGGVSVDERLLIALFLLVLAHSIPSLDRAFRKFVSWMRRHS